MNHDCSGPTNPRRPYDAALYATLYRRVEPRIREVTRAVHAGRLSPEVGRERVREILVSLNESYCQAALVAPLTR